MDWIVISFCLTVFDIDGLKLILILVELIVGAIIPSLFDSKPNWFPTVLSKPNNKANLTGVNTSNSLFSIPSIFESVGTILTSTL